MTIPLWIALPALIAAAGTVLWLSHRLRSLDTRSSRAAWGRLAGFLLLTVLICAFVGVNLIARQRALHLVYPRHTPISLHPERVGILDYQAVSFTTHDKLELRGWYLPPPPSVSRPAPAVILVHGFGGNRGALLPEAAMLQQDGYGVLMYDSRAAGESQGSLNSFGLYEVEDVRAALAFLSTQPEIDTSRVGLLGHSQGSSTVIHAAAQIPEIRAVIAESVFISMKDNIYSGVEHLLNLPPVLFAPFVVAWGEYESGMDIDAVRPVDQVRQISPRPVLIIHGALDQLLPVENARAMYAAAGDPRRLVILPNAGHSNLREAGGQAYWDAVLGFFQEYLR